MLIFGPVIAWSESSSTCQIRTTPLNSCVESPLALPTQTPIGLPSRRKRRGASVRVAQYSMRSVGAEASEGAPTVPDWPENSSVARSAFDYFHSSINDLGQAAFELGFARNAHFSTMCHDIAAMSVVRPNDTSERRQIPTSVSMWVDTIC